MRNAFDVVAVEATAVELQHELGRVEPPGREVLRSRSTQARDRRLQPLPGGVRQVREPVEQVVREWAGEQRPRGVGAGVDGAGRAGRGGHLEGAVEAIRVEPQGACRDDGRLAVGRQCLVGTEHHRVGAQGQRVWRIVGMETEVGTPGLVDHDRHAPAWATAMVAGRSDSAPR